MCAHFLSLVWDNHHSLLINAFNELLENNIAVNCTIVAEGHQVKVHQVLLSSFSPFFESLLKEENEKHPTIILVDTSYQDLRALVHYMYNGKMEISQDQIKSLLETANYLQIKGLGGASEDDSSEKTKLISPLHERQIYFNPQTYKRKNGGGAVVPAQDEIMDSESCVQHLTPLMSSAYQIGQSPIRSIPFDATLESSVQRLSFVPVPSTSHSFEADSFPLHGEPVVKVERQDEMFLCEDVHPHESEWQKNEVIFSDSSRDNQGISEEATICVKSEDNSLVDPAEVESNAFVHSELDLKVEDVSEEETAIIDGASVSSMEQGGTLAEDRHIPTSRNAFSGEKNENETVEDVKDEKEQCVTKSKSSAIVCFVCKKVLYGKNNFTDHMKIHADPNIFKCSICNINFTQRSNLTEHMNIHSGDKPFECSNCNLRFAYKSTLTAHMRKHSGEKPFGCVICNIKFSRKTNFISHMKIHSGEKPFECNICNIKFRHKCNLTAHLRNHAGEKPFQCSNCNIKFARKCTLIVHMRIHSGEKRFECSNCNMKFAQKCALIVHMRIHSGEKPFECSNCNMRFADKSNLARHMRKHSGEKPFECFICNAKFTEKSSLTRHTKIHSG